jgi:DNA-binding helix-hairpin-helix protein with protein kinase domain
MTLQGLHNEHYIISRELGRGGEGIVYELHSHPNLVLKRYSETIPAEKIAKLRQMVSMRTETIEAYAAWPIDIVRDQSGFICGFVMRKLFGYVPLHMIFSPMDRKKMFPDKGYNFLVHVSRNLATAFHKLHEAGLVVGDINEGNILISSSGLVAFIDCDSFQVKDGNNYFYCEVGVPRYTPPELLDAGTFQDIVRTANTDSFSMAVLIFQLLFLGRHPFAGRHKSAADIDEETAIRQKQFAYSLYNKKKKLSPPKDSFPITNLSDEVVALFHQAFEQNERPLPAAWIPALDHQLQNMVTCAVSRLHSYPSKLAECPWCVFRKERGIMYFLDDNYIHASAVLSDIENFVNGFRPEKLVLKKWGAPQAPRTLSPNPVNRKYTRLKREKTVLALGVLAVCMGLAFAHEVFIAIGLLAAYYFYKHSPAANAIKKEARRQALHIRQLKEQLNTLIIQHDTPADLKTYTLALGELEKLVHNFRRLPDEFERRKKTMEERVYNEQLDFFLSRFAISEHEIPSFGGTKKQSLYNNGIYSAADISKLATVKVPGIGPKNQQILISWQRQMASGFVYIPDNSRLATETNLINHDIAGLKRNLENAIRKEYQSLNYIKQNISNRSAILEQQMNGLLMNIQQAEIDLIAFEKAVR